VLILSVEGCPDKWIAFWSGICKATGLFGTVLGMGFVALLRENLHEEQFYKWGWRIPFLTSIIMGSFGVYLRSFLKESKEFVQNQTKGQNDNNSITAAPSVIIWDVVKFHWPEIISVALIVSFWATGFYTCFVWMAYYTSELMTGEAVPHAWLLNTVMMGVFVAVMPCTGLLADSVCHHLYQGQDIGYRRCMILGALVVVLLGKIPVMLYLLFYLYLKASCTKYCVYVCDIGLYVYRDVSFFTCHTRVACPVFYLMNLKTAWSVCAGYVILSLGLALYGSCLPVVMVKQVRH
jgi:MHS family proline/betaine transporter-like MFS transporter